MATTGTDGRALKERRELLGWSKLHTARVSGVSRPTLDAVERGDSKVRPGTVARLEAALQEAERERRRAIDTYNIDAYNSTARAVGDLEELLDRGAITPGGALLSIRSVVDAYSAHIEEVDPEAVEQAAKYTAALVKARMRTRSERN